MGKKLTLQHALEKWNEFQILQPNSELWDKAKLISIGVL